MDSQHTPAQVPDSPTTGPAEQPRDPNWWEPFFAQILPAIRQGRLIPFFGAGVNRCGRPEGTKAAPDDFRYLPDGTELAQYLIQPWKTVVGTHSELERVSQYVILRESDGAVFYKLHELFARDYPPTKIHRFFARLPKILQQKGYPATYPLIMTTNYDDVMERAFEAEGQPYHVLYYRVDGDHRGKFFHVAYDASGQVEKIDRPTDEAGLPARAGRPIDDPDSYLAVSPQERPVVVKLHGAVERDPALTDYERGSFVIAEDHYVEYLTGPDIRKLLPLRVRERLLVGGFLFLGYGLRDWTVRLLMHRIAVEQKRRYRSWAVMLKPDVLDTEVWGNRKVDLLDTRLEEFIEELERRMAELPGETS